MASVPQWSLDEAIAATQSVDLRHRFGAAVDAPVVIFAARDDDPPAAWQAVAERLRGLALVTVAPTGDVADAIGDVDQLVSGVLRNPQAATVAVQVLRAHHADIHDALTLESLAYAALQSGPEHAAWRHTQGRRVRRDSDARVRLDDLVDEVHLTLTRPRLHNLIDRQARDELAAAFAMLGLPDDDRTVRWAAEGRSFSAGGDPAEFGTVADPATGHAIRMAAGPAPHLAAIAHRVTAAVHGACVGAGIELAAFAGHVVAHPDTRFRLPELTMGLLPGVGGTWSIPRRIGRRRTLEWLLLDQEIDASTASEWGLVDEISGAE